MQKANYRHSLAFICRWICDELNKANRDSTVVHRRGRFSSKQKEQRNREFDQISSPGSEMRSYFLSLLC